MPSMPADFPSCFVVVGLDTISICASFRLACCKIISPSDGIFFSSQALVLARELSSKSSTSVSCTFF
jgi:hypothetical protein